MQKQLASTVAANADLSDFGPGVEKLGQDMALYRPIAQNLHDGSQQVSIAASQVSQARRQSYVDGAG